MPFVNPSFRDIPPRNASNELPHVVSVKRFLLPKVRLLILGFDALLKIGFPFKGCITDDHCSQNNEFIEMQAMQMMPHRKETQLASAKNCAHKELNRL